MTPVSTFAPDKIKQARLQAGLTQAQLARRAETTEKNIARWENGHNQPRAQHVAAIAAATGHTTDYFFDNESQEVSPSSGDQFRHEGGSGVDADRGIAGVPGVDGVTRDAA